MSLYIEGGGVLGFNDNGNIPFTDGVDGTIRIFWEGTDYYTNAEASPGSYVYPVVVDFQPIHIAVTTATS